MEVFRENNNVTNHQRKIQILLTEVFKTTKNLSTSIMEDMFNARPNNYNRRNFQEMVTKKKENSQKGT